MKEINVPLVPNSPIASQSAVLPKRDPVGYGRSHAALDTLGQLVGLLVIIQRLDNVKIISKLSCFPYFLEVTLKGYRNRDIRKYVSGQSEA